MIPKLISMWSESIETSQKGSGIGGGSMRKDLAEHVYVKIECKNCEGSIQPMKLTIRYDILQLTEKR